MTGSGTNILSFCLFSGIEGAFYESGSKTVIPRKVSMQYVRLQFSLKYNGNGNSIISKLKGLVENVHHRHRHRHRHHNHSP